MNSLRFPRLWSATALLLICSACADTAAPDVMEVDANALFDIGEDVAIEENERVLSVRPSIAADQSGYLVSDMDESQLRVYSPRGKLLISRGSHGDGPGEYRQLVAARRSPGGGIAAFEMSARVTLLNETTDSVRGTVRLDATSIKEALVLDDTLAFVAAYPDPAGNRLRLVNYRTGVTIRSFFAPQYPQQLSRIAYIFPVTFDLRHDTLAIVAGGTNILYYYSTAGDSIDSTTLDPRIAPPLDVSSFPSPISAPGLMDWLKQQTVVTGVAWAGPNILLALTVPAEEERTMRAAYISRDGRGDMITHNILPFSFIGEGRVIIFPTIERNLWRTASIRADLFR